MIIRIKGLKRYVDRQGNARLYHRATGTPIDTSLSAAEIAVIVARLDRIKPKVIGKTFGALLKSYQASPRFIRLAPRTQSDYAKILTYLQPLGDKPLAAFDTPFIARLRDKTFAVKRAGFANHMLAMLSSAFRHGVEYGFVKSNPVENVEKATIPRDRKRKARPWSPAEIAAVIPNAPPHLRLVLVLAAGFGFRRGDIIKLRAAYFDGDYLTLETSKTGRAMRLPVLPQLAALITAHGGGDYLCVTSRGTAWTEAGLSASLDKYFKRCAALGYARSGITLHGLRHYVSTRLRESGYDAGTARLYVGHEDPAMTEHYSSSADMTPAIADMARVVQGGLPL